MTTGNEVEKYFASLQPEQRQALDELRACIRAVAPGASEYMYYRMPAFRLNGPVVSYAAFREHYSLFPLGSALLDALGDAVSGYRTSKGTLQFRYGVPLPKDVVATVVRARLERAAARSRKPRTRKR